MDLDRYTAWEALVDIEKNGAYSNLAVGRAIEKRSPAQEGFVRTLVYGVLENQMYIDYMLGFFLKKGIRQVRLPARILLRMGVYQMEFMESVPDYAAIGESVTLAKKTCRGLEGFVNGVLRSFQRNKNRIVMPDRKKDPLEYLSIRYSYSRDITAMWLRMFGPQRTESLMKAGNESPAITICVNSTKITKEELQEQLQRDGFQVESPDPVCTGVDSAVADRALAVKGSGLLSTDYFRKGLFYVQDLSSMRAVGALAPGAGDFVLDVCAAPGGKSFFAALCMGDRGRILSCDIYEHKLKLIKGTADRLGLQSIQVRQQDASQFTNEFAEQADCVIVDVPCSGLGVVRRRPEIKLRMTEKDCRDLSEIQTRILLNSAGYVKPGGRLMYSTCTISDAENERVSEIFLKKNSDFSILSKKQLYPDRDFSDGFYYCVFQKK